MRASNLFPIDYIFKHSGVYESCNVVLWSYNHRRPHHGTEISCTKRVVGLIASIVFVTVLKLHIKCDAVNIGQFVYIFVLYKRYVRVFYFYWTTANWVVNDVIIYRLICFLSDGVQHFCKINDDMAQKWRDFLEPVPFRHNCLRSFITRPWCEYTRIVSSSQKWNPNANINSRIRFI